MKKLLIIFVIIFCLASLLIESSFGSCDTNFEQEGNESVSTISTSSLKESRLNFRKLIFRYYLALDHADLIATARDLLDESHTTPNLSQPPEHLWQSISNKNLDLWAYTILAAYGYERPFYHRKLGDLTRTQDDYLMLIDDFLARWDLFKKRAGSDYLAAREVIRNEEIYYFKRYEKNLEIIDDQINLLSDHNDLDSFVAAKKTLIETLESLSATVAEEAVISHEITKNFETILAQAKQSIGSETFAAQLSAAMYFSSLIEDPSEVLGDENCPFHIQAALYATHSQKLSYNIEKRIKFLLNRVRKQRFKQLI